MRDSFNDSGCDDSMRREFIIDGNDFNDIEGFYSIIDRLFTKGLDWKTGHNLNAFNDILRGGFGVHDYGEPIKIIWKNFALSRKTLGYEETVKNYEKWLPRCHPTGVESMKARLADARNETGETLLDIIVDIILDTDDSGHDCILEIIE